MAKEITTEVTVKSTARLHMGFFDLHGGLGRKFGSIGLSLTSPSLDITVSASKELRVSGLHISPVLGIAKKLIAEIKLNQAVNVNVKQLIPEHSGLGSGTQLALAIGAAINRLYGLNLSVDQIAELSGRGGRSGIGIGAFKFGGLLIDGGRKSNTLSTSPVNAQSLATSITSSLKVPPLLARYDFPEDWRILLIFDNSQLGIHGDEELVAFKQLPVFSENLAAHLCRSVLMQAMPALLEHDLTAFGGSVRLLQEHVGDYFAPAQGGRYASKKVGAVLQDLEASGVACFGQSSWGPTGFAVFENLQIAESYLQQLKITFVESNLTWAICSANNRGAEILQIN